MTVDVDLTHHRTVHSNRNDDLRLRLKRACKIALIGVHIVDNDRVILGDSRSADSLVYWNTDMFGWRSMKGPKDKHLRIVGIEHVEAGPVVIRQAVRNHLNDEALQSPKVGRGFRKGLYFRKNLSERFLRHALILRLRYEVSRQYRQSKAY